MSHVSETSGVADSSHDAHPPEKCRVAVVQASPIYMDREATINKGVALIQEAADHGAQVIAFPETWVPGYPLWIYGAAGWGDEAAKRGYAQLLAESVEVPSEETDALSHVAVDRGVEVVMGINERSGGSVFNSLLYVRPDGALQVHRKLVPTHAERIVWAASPDGSGLVVVETPFGGLGGLICWEHWMPLTRFAMHAQSERIHVAVWPWGYELAHLASRHYAFEGRSFVVVAAGYMPASALPPGFELREAMNAGSDPGGGGTVLQTGGSGVIGPDGQWVVGPVHDEETIVYADLDLGHAAREQYAMDIVGHYNRPDIFSLTVDTRRRPQVSWLTQSSDAAAEALAETH
jgi:predicted amidohydrolase